MTRAQLTILIAALLAALFGVTTPCAHAAELTRVELRSGVRADEGQSLTLADVADIRGPLADALGKLLVLDEAVSGLGAAEIDPTDTLALIASAHPRDRHSIVVSGLTCRVYVNGVERRAPPTRVQSRAETEPVDQTTPIAQMAKRQIRSVLGFADAELRFSFLARDADFLATALDGLSVVMTVGGRSDTVPVRVTLYRGDVLVDQRDVRVGVEVRREVAVAQGTLRSREIISKDAFRTERQWVAAGDRPADPADVQGQTARVSIRAGRVISELDIRPPIVVKRGDVVVLRSVRGGASVGLRARALGDARAGDVIDFRRDSTGVVVRARVSRAGEAIIASTTAHDTSAQPETPQTAAQEDNNSLRQYRRQ